MPKQLEDVLNYETPEVIFFPFWSWKVSDEMLAKYKCVGFHTGNYRGGSPIQHLIRNGHTEAAVKAFRLNSKFDDGLVLTSRTVQLHGTLEEIVMRITDTIVEIIDALKANPRQSYYPTG